jgi:flagellar motility protein MotE (MotC chaperone)
MMKLVVLTVLGLLVGTGGGSAAAVLKARKAFAAVTAVRARFVADSLAKASETTSAHEPSAKAEESAAATSAVATSKAPPSEPPPPSTEKTEWNRAVATVDAHGAPPPSAAGAEGHARTPALPAKPIAVAIPPATAKVAKILALMPAKDAAKVMERLDDDDVQAIIGSVSEKQAAAILQNFPPERAAVISKGVMRAGVSKP